MGIKINIGPPRRPGQTGPVEPPHYYVEFVISIMVFFYIGGKVTITAYLGSYVSYSYLHMYLFITHH